MTRLRRPVRLLLYGTAGLLLLIAVALVAARFYLSSGRVANQVRQRLQEFLGGTVQVGAVDLGLTGDSSVSGITVYDEDRAAGVKPWIRIARVRADVSALGLARGQMPQSVTLHDAQLSLHFAADDRLLTRLPAVKPTPGLRLPGVSIEGGTLTIEQDGRPPMVVHGIHADVTGEGGAVRVKGTVDDPTWGQWTAEASYDPDTHRVSLRLECPPRLVKMEQLRSLPFISAKVWEEVQVEGDTPVVFTLAFQPPGQGVLSARGLHSRIEMQPRDTWVQVSSIDLTATGASGKLVVEDKVVTLTGVRGHTAGGEIATDAVLDFRPRDSVLDFKRIEVRGVAIHKLPHSWRLPPFDGRLTGRARLSLTVVNGKAVPRGSGEGQIEDARWGLVRLKRPIRLALHTDGRRIRFGQKGGEPAAALMGLGPVALVAPEPDPISFLAGLTSGALALPAAAARGVGRATTNGIAAASQALHRVASVGRKPAGPHHDYVEADLNLEDVDLAGLVSGLAISLPYRLAGQASVHIHLGVPIDAPRDFKAYQLRGSATLPRLEVAGLRMTAVRARLRYEDGVLTLTEGSGHVSAGHEAAASTAAGTFAGAGRLQLIPAGNLIADLRLTDVNAVGLLQELPQVPVRVEGTVSGTVHAELSAEAPRRPRTLTARLELTAPRLRVDNLPAERLRGGLNYGPDGGDYQLQGDTLGGHFRLQGKLPPPGGPLPPADEGTGARPDGRLQVEGVRLGRLAGALGWRGAFSSLHGAVTLDLPFRHDGASSGPTGRGSFQISELRWDDQDLGETMRGDVQVGPDGLDLANVTGSLGQGGFRAHVRLPLGRARAGSFSFTLVQAEASRLLRPVPGLNGHLEGPVDISLRGRIGGEWHGGGSVVLSRGRVFGVEVTEWRVPVRFAYSPQGGQGELTVADTSATVGLGRATGRLDVTLGAGARLTGGVRFFDVDLRTLVQAAAEFSTVASGRLSGRIDVRGSDVRSADDLTATISADLSQAQAMQAPVLRQLIPFLRSGSSSATFHSGHLEARLSHGLVRIQRFTLEGGLLEMIIEGTLTLEGRLSLEVTARTDNLFYLPPALRLLGIRIPAAGALPVSLITEASILLANRVVHLRVTGTLRNPIVQVEPVRLLTEEAVRYFLTRSIVPRP
jgi:hypothetical protein